MAEHKITATGRKDEGKGASRRLRHAAQIPAIVYGGHADPQSIQLEHEKTWLASQNEWFYSSILVARPRRHGREGAAARHAAPPVQAADHAPGFPARERERGDPRQRAAALRQRGNLAGGQGRRRGADPRDERGRGDLPAEGPAGVHRGRPGEDGDRRHDPPLRRQVARRRAAELKIDDEHDPAVAVARHVKEEVEEEVVAEEGAEVPAVKQDEEGAGDAAEGEGEDK